ncbi:glutathione S-transferase family protein [Roseibium sp.]|uniref:glutathione S-transferase family protein n=1 Tax=Roseibium sp. TaxID=1936156 RepID=UPI003B524DF2
MKFYNAMSGNTKRVRIFLAEKDIDIPRIDLELGRDTRTAEYRKINSLGEVPALELDDGEVITESRAICRYLERQFPEHPLMGRTPAEEGKIAMWSDRIHGHLFMTYGLYVRHTLDLFDGVVDQVPEFARTMLKAIPEKWTWLDSEMSDGRPFIAGKTFSFADIEGMTTMMIADALDLGIPEACRHVHAWANAMRTRPSWQA